MISASHALQIATNAQVQLFAQIARSSSSHRQMELAQIDAQSQRFGIKVFLNARVLLLQLHLLD